MNPKQQQAMAERLVELLIKADVFKERNCRACVGGLYTDIHTWITMKETLEKEDFIHIIKHAIIMHENECLARAWAKHKKEIGI